MENVKKKIKGVGTVYPCKKCGMYPIWGSGFLLCPNDCYETAGNEPNGSSVREWNKVNTPNRLLTSGEMKEEYK